MLIHALYLGGSECDQEGREQPEHVTNYDLNWDGGDIISAQSPEDCQSFSNQHPLWAMTPAGDLWSVWLNMMNSWVWNHAILISMSSIPSNIYIGMADFSLLQQQQKQIARQCCREISHFKVLIWCWCFGRLVLECSDIFCQLYYVYTNILGHLRGHTSTVQGGRSMFPSFDWTVNIGRKCRDRETYSTARSPASWGLNKGLAAHGIQVQQILFAYCMLCFTVAPKPETLDSLNLEILISVTSSKIEISVGL